jgi:hypothetical protein
MDISGGHQLDVIHNIFKTRLDPSGRPIHSEKQSLYSLLSRSLFFFV